MKIRHLYKRMYVTLTIWKSIPILLWKPKRLVGLKKSYDHTVLNNTLRWDGMSKEERYHSRKARRIMRWVLIPNASRVVSWRIKHGWFSRLIISWHRRWNKFLMFCLLVKILTIMKQNNDTIEDFIQSHLYYCKRSGKDMKYVRRIHKWVYIPWLTDMTT